jgi:uncharacterized protein (TIGR03437 family)
MTHTRSTKGTTDPNDPQPTPRATRAWIKLSISRPFGSLKKHSVSAKRDLERFVVFLFVLAQCTAFGQRTPVVLVDGYHLICQSDNLVSSQDFGELEQRLTGEGVQVVFFPTCRFSGKPSIEDLGNALGTTVRGLNTSQVDLISHSMGGLIVRSYLAGKQTPSGVFTPPTDPQVRKWVSIATPNFGALLPDIISGFLPDLQAQELVAGSQFLFDLATWNQNRDDLRGVDTVGIIGNAGGIWPVQGSNDGTVAVTSASMSFVLPDERTRVLPYCHGAGIFTTILGFGCDAPPLARIQSDNPLSWRIIDSFLGGSDDWKSIGRPPSQDAYLSQFGGVLFEQRDSLDRPTAAPQDQNFVSKPPLTGGYTVVIDKPGPRIALIIPSAARLPVLSLAPRMLISIYGYNLANSIVTVNGQALAISYAAENQINTLLPENIRGLAKLTVSNEQGQQTTNIFIEAAAPAIFTKDGTGSGTAAAFRVGDVVELYLTGLGVDSTTPIVTLNGVATAVEYAGPAPGYPGLDQINFHLPAGVQSGTVVVRVGNRVSNAVIAPAE